MGRCMADKLPNDIQSKWLQFSDVWSGPDIKLAPAEW